MFDKKLNFIISAVDKATGPIKGVGKSLGSISGQAVKAGAVVAGAVTSALGAVAAFGVNSARKIEQSRVAFENLYGSAEDARDMMQNLSDFAKVTPFQFDELADVTLKLKNVAGVGDDEVIPMLENLGDLASSQSKGLTQIVEAYNDAITGEFERLKEFGIKAKQEGDKVAFTFRGQTKEVDKTADAIGGYLREIGQMEGISGAMEKQSKTMSGRLSTLKDTLKNFAMAVVGVSESGDIIEGGIFDKVSKAVGFAVDFLDENREKIMSVINDITSFVSGLFDVLYNTAKVFFGTSSGDFSSFFEDIKEIVKVGFDVIKGFWDKYGEDIKVVLGFVYDIVTQIFKNIFDTIGPVVQSGLDIIGGLFSFFSDLIQLDLQGASDNLNQIFISLFELLGNTTMLGFGVVLGIFGTSMDEIKQGVSDGIEALGYYWEALKTNLETIWMKIKNNADEILIRGLLGVITLGLSEIFIQWAGGWDVVVDYVYSAVQPMVDWVKSKLDAIVGFVNQIKSAIKGAASFVGIGNNDNQNSTPVTGARALGGTVLANKSYLVGERGPEIFTPSSTGKINNNPGGSNQVVINMGGVTVKNEADENRLVEKIKQALTRDAQLYNSYGIN